MVERIYECGNASEYPETTYEIAPEELLRAINDIERRGMEVLGFYHSHPMGLDGPSSIDEGRATWQGYSYVIVSISRESSISSWRWDEAKNKFEKEEVRGR
jgi:proteasome lid subunit RPN8/RPN11